MSAGDVVQAALVARLAAALPVSVFDAPPVRGGEPYAVVDDPVLTDWSTKTWTGREGRVSVWLTDGAERPVRLRELMAGVEAALADWAPELPGGWRLVRCTFVRSRLVRAGAKGDERWRAAEGGRWRATGEWLVRMYRQDS